MPSQPFKTADELTAEVRSRVRQVTATEVMAQLASPAAPVLLDVRDPDETSLGIIPGAVCISRGRLESHVEALIPRDAEIVIYCASGNRSAFAAETLAVMGYARVASMAGGILGWVDAGGDVE